MRNLLLLTSICVACGSDPGGGAPSPDTTDDGGPPAADSSTQTDSASPAQQDAAGPDAVVCPLYYQDGDGDGFGGTKTMTSCTDPGGNWITIGGDCDDGNPLVYPTESKYYAVAYNPTGGGDPSFDYDCSGTEDELGALAKGSACTLGKSGCTGQGFMPVSPVRPADPGVDEYCGTDLWRVCNETSSTCSANDFHSGNHIVCR
jgi:hypothetical protein